MFCVRVKLALARILSFLIPFSTSVMAKLPLQSIVALNFDDAIINSSFSVDSDVNNLALLPIVAIFLIVEIQQKQRNFDSKFLNFELFDTEPSQ